MAGNPNFIQMPADSTGKKVQTWDNIIGGQDVHTEAVTITDSTGTEKAVSGNPLRIDPTGTTIQPVDGSLTNNNAAPAATQIGVMPALANAANPSWTEGNQVLESVDLSGNMRVKVNAALPAGTNVIGHVITDSGSTTAVTGTVTVSGTVTDNQGTAAASTAGWPVIGGNVAESTVAWTSSTSINTALSLTVTGYNTVVVTLNQGTTITGGVVTFEVSDSSTNWYAISASETNAFTASTTYTLTANTNQAFQVNVSGFVTFRVRLSTVISGTGTVNIGVQANAMAAEGIVTVGQSSGSSLHVDVDNFPGTQPVSGTVSLTAGTAVELLDSGGSNKASISAGGALKVDGSAVTQPVSGTVTANIGTTNGLALDASVTGLQVSQGSTTSGEKGTLIQGAVTTSAPSYTTAQTSPLSLDTSGNLRTSVNNTVTVSGSGNFNENLSQVNGATVSTAASGVQKVGVVGNSGAVLDFAGQNASAPANSVLVGGEFNTTPTTISSGNASPLQLDASGNLLVNVKAGSSGNAAASATGSAVPADADYNGVNVGGTLRGQTGVNPSGSVFAAQTDITSIGGSTVSTAASGVIKTGIVGNTGAAMDAAGQNASSPANELLVAGQFNTTPTTVSTGNVSPLQLDSSANLRVIQSDLSPASVNITTQDLASSSAGGFNSVQYVTGTPTAGSAASFTLNACDCVAVQITGSWTGTMAMEISVDGGTTWVNDSGFQIGTSFRAGNITGNTISQINVAGCTNVRVRSIAAQTGTATVQVVESKAPSLVTVSNAMRLVDAGNAANTGTIKAASTQSVATDTSLVVQINPNQPNLTTPLNVAGTTVTGGDAVANTALEALATSDQPLVTAGFGYNGSTWDRLRTAGVGNSVASTGLLAESAYGQFSAPFPSSSLVATTSNFAAKQIDSQGRLEASLVDSLQPFIIQKANATSTNSVTTLNASFGSNNTVGNTIVVIAASGSNGAMSVTDTLGNTYTQAANVSNGTTLQSAIFYATNCKGGANTNVTLACSSSSAALEIYEVNGLWILSNQLGQAVSGEGQTATNTGSSTSSTTAAILPILPNEYAFTALGVGTANVTFSAFSPYTKDFSGNTGGTQSGLFSFAAFSQPLTGLTSVSFASTLSISEPWAAVTVFFKPTSVPVQGVVVADARATTTLPTTATAGNPVVLMADTAGRLITRGGGPRERLVTNNLTLTATGSNTLVAAGAASVFRDLTFLQASNTSSTAVRIDISDGTRTYSWFLAASGGGFNLNFNPPLAASSSATAWTAAISASVTDVRVSVQGVETN